MVDNLYRPLQHLHRSLAGVNVGFPQLGPQKVIPAKDVQRQVTIANVHDSQAVEELVDKRDEHHEMLADSAHVGPRIEKVLEMREIRNRIHEKGYRNRPLTKRQIADNRKKSRVRARVEHVFGHISNSMKGFYIRTIGILRARAMIGIINLTYNMARFIQIQRA
jgi:transposase, IS5 family